MANKLSILYRYGKAEFQDIGLEFFLVMSTDPRLSLETKAQGKFPKKEV